MDLWIIFIGAFSIAFSGAMMPGPMLGVTIDGSLRKGWTAGPRIVLGHGILELVLILTMTFGLKDFFSNPTVAGFIGLFGGAFLAWMGCGMIKSGIKKSVTQENSISRENNPSGKRGVMENNLVLAGVLVSATNPYFILWWATTGTESIRRAFAAGIIGVLIFFTGHILADLVWYTAMSAAFSRGKKLVGSAGYHRMVLILGLFLVVFSIYFIGSGSKMLLGL